MIAYIKHLRCSAKATHFGPFYYIQIDPQDYDEWRIETPEEEIHFQSPSNSGRADGANEIIVVGSEGD